MGKLACIKEYYDFSIGHTYNIGDIVGFKYVIYPSTKNLVFYIYPNFNDISVYSWFVPREIQEYFSALGRSVYD